MTAIPRDGTDRGRREIPFLAAVLLLLLAAASAVAGPTEALRVSYVSPEHVYVNGGTAAGIAEGDTLAVVKKESPVASLVVEFAAERSASCRVVAGSGTIAVGDLVRPRRVDVTTEATADSLAAPPSPARRERPIPGLAPSGSHRSQVRSWGSAALEYLRSSSTSSADGGFARSTLRLNLTVVNLADLYSINVHWRLRHDDRYDSDPAGVPSSEWRDQLYAVSLRRDGGKGGLNGEIGRFSPPLAYAGGLMDGLLVSSTFSGAWEGGVFVGTEPTWGSTLSGSAVRKVGTFASYRGRASAELDVSAGAAVVGEYERGAVSREFVSFRSSMEGGDAWSFSPSMIIDVNRGWRRGAAGELLSLSRLDLTAVLYPSGPLSLRAGFERHLRPWTTDVRSLPDSLFDASPGQGYRLNAFLRDGHWSFGAGAGAREGAGSSSRNWFWNADARRLGVFDGRTSVSLRANGHSGTLSRGVSPALEVRHDTVRGPGVGFGAGLYRYTARGLPSAQTSMWTRLDAVWTVGHGYELNAEYQHGTADAFPAHMVRLGLVRRI